MSKKQTIQATQGWQCPICGNVYAPHVTQCSNVHTPPQQAIAPYDPYWPYPYWWHITPMRWPGGYYDVTNVTLTTSGDTSQHVNLLDNLAVGTVYLNQGDALQGNYTDSCASLQLVK